VTWLVHQYRQAYDWYGTPRSDFSPQPDSVQLRQTIFEIDRRTLGESQRLFAISRNVAARLQRFNGLSAQPLYPPTLHEGKLRCDGYNDTIAYVGRLDTAKRVDLLLHALHHTPAGVRCVIAGAGQERLRLERLAQELNLGERVRFLGWVDDATLLRLYAECFAVFYAPVDEDYGLATVEAFQAAKPVVTALDSGGVLEFVEDGVTGCVSEPEPRALAAAIARLYADRALCARLGEAGRALVADIKWETTINRLLEPL
jgi:glycosyltransferase involved in cell wall biosynthesis